MTVFPIDRRRVLWLAGSVGLAGLAPRFLAAAEPAVVMPVQKLSDTLIQIMKMGANTSFAERFKVLAPVIDTAFDLERILQVSVGLGWGAVPPDQKTALQAAFRSYTVASYVDSFDSFTGQRFLVSPDTRSLADGNQVVQTEIVSPSGASHKLDYVMHRTSQGWKAVDVLADGTISRVAVQRSDFRQILQDGGASALVASLQRKTHELSGGV